MLSPVFMVTFVSIDSSIFIIICNIVPLACPILGKGELGTHTKPRVFILVKWLLFQAHNSYSKNMLIVWLISITWLNNCSCTCLDFLNSRTDICNTFYWNSRLAKPHNYIVFSRGRVEFPFFLLKVYGHSSQHFNVSLCVVPYLTCVRGAIAGAEGCTVNGNLSEYFIFLTTCCLLYERHSSLQQHRWRHVICWSRRWVISEGLSVRIFADCWIFFIYLSLTYFFLFISISMCVILFIWECGDAFH